MVFTVESHFVCNDGLRVDYRPTPNKGGIIVPTLLVMHYTAGFTAASAIATLTSPASQASAHLVIDRHGGVTQLAPLNNKTWHAGKSSWRGRSMCNGFSIGIELVNCGPLLERADGEIVAEVAPRKVIGGEDAVMAHHPNGERTKYWQVYPEAQIEAAEGVARAICEAYRIKEIAGHYDIAPTRKRDPGPAFPMASFVSRVLGRADDEDEPVAVPPARFASPELRRGDSGEYVAALQYLLNLNKAVISALSQDGDFGFKTELALIAFQKRAGLVADGVAGINTWAALRARKDQ